MESSELLLAFQVRDLAMKRLVAEASEKNVPIKSLLKDPGIEPYVVGVTKELIVISNMIKNVSL